MWFDSHCHLDFEQFDADREQVLERARRVGVTQLFVPGVAPLQWQKLAPLRANYPEICVGVGMHPWFIHEIGSLDDELGSLDAVCSQLGAVAVGETGLDELAARRGGAALELQTRVFERHIEVAQQLRLPLVLHVVRAHGPALDVLEKHGPYPAGGVLHSYSGAPELVARYARLGLSFSFSGLVTRASAKRARAAVVLVEDARLMLETDAPDQVPEGFAAERNEPRALLEVARAVARLRHAEPDVLLQRASENAARLYGFRPQPLKVS